MTIDAKPTNKSSRSSLAAAAVGFATAVVLMAGIQARSGGDSQPVVDAPATVVAVDSVSTGASDTAMSGDDGRPDPRSSNQMDDPMASPAAGMAPVESMDRRPSSLADAEDSPTEFVAVNVSVPDAPQGPDCQVLAEELWRREDAGEIVYEDYVEVSEEDLDRYPLDLPVPDGTVAAPGERPSFASFGDGYDVANIANNNLDEAVGHCWELGLID